MSVGRCATPGCVFAAGHETPCTNQSDGALVSSPCEHCVSGAGVHVEQWQWALVLGETGAAVELGRDGVVKLLVPLTEGELVQLMDGPVSLAGVLRDGL